MILFRIYEQKNEIIKLYIFVEELSKKMWTSSMAFNNEYIKYYPPKQQRRIN